MQRISVVIPVYNENENIAACLSGLERVLSPHEHEILICYDLDGDTTLDAIASMQDRPASLVFVKNAFGRGAANAIRSGFAAATGDVVVVTMADLSDPPEVILDMVRKIRSEGADVVSASRYMKGGSQTGGPRLKALFSRAAGLSLRWLAGVPTHDATNSFRAYSRRFLDSVTVESRKGFELGLELTVKAHLAGFSVDEVPTAWRDRSEGKSRFRMWRWMPAYLKWYFMAIRGARERPRPFTIFAVGCLLWLSVMSMPQAPSRISIDISWRMALTEAAKHDMHAGVDYIFTYGPLGRFYNMVYDRDVFYRQMAWEVLWSLVLTVVLVMVFARMKGAVAKGVFVLVAAVVLPVSRDALYIVTLLTVSMLIVGARRERLRTGLVLGLPILAMIALMKFTFLVFALVCVTVIVAALWRIHGLKAAMGAAGGYVFALGMVWTLTGQPLVNFPAYIRGSLELAEGYSDSMSGLGRGAWKVPVGLTVLAMGFLLSALSLAGAKPRTARVAMALLMATGFFLAWKEGFTRNDRHVFMMMAFGAGASFLFEIPASTRRAARAAFRVICFLLICTSLVGAGLMVRELRDFACGFISNWRWGKRVIDNVSVLTMPARWRDAQEERLATMRREFWHRRMRLEINGSTVDLIPSYQLGRLFLNHFNWHPRPIFQSYSVYTPWLLEKNAEFFRRDDAPQFVIMNIWSIDRQVPLMADWPAIHIILRDYQPVLKEDRHFLLRRRDDATHSAPVCKPLYSKSIGFGEWVGVPDGCEGGCILKVNLEYSLLGKLRKFFYRGPMLNLNVAVDDGEPKHRRLIPGMAKVGFLVDPYLRRQRELALWCAGEPVPSVSSLSVTVATGGEKYFAGGPVLEFCEGEMVQRQPDEKTRRELLSGIVRARDSEPAAAFAR